MTLPAELGATAFFVALAAGAASFLSPCVLPLLPAYLSFVSGLSVEELRRGDRRVALNTLAFVLGFALVFTLLGAGFSFAGVLLANRRMVQVVAGGLLVLLGILIASGGSLPFLRREVRPLLGRMPGGAGGAFAVGVAFSLGWTPCVGPVLASILTMAASGQSPGAGALLLFVYSLGLGIPFLAAGLFVGRVLRAFARIRKHLRLIQVICGIILAAYGMLLIAGEFGWLSARLAGWGVPLF
ncbi:MAG: sulfite exporter TauE/SafE family protein [Thermoleophilia bacterium]|nr:sulfite exporter TauE/SafE family protein [Thermoleophilia bacterium]